MRYGGRGTNPERSRGIEDEYISHHFFAKGHTCQNNLILSTFVSRGGKIFFHHSLGLLWLDRERDREREHFCIHSSIMILVKLLNKKYFPQWKPTFFMH